MKFLDFKKIVSLWAVVACSIGMVAAKDVWVSPKGKDTNSGSEKSPVKSMQAAAKLLKKSYTAEPFNEAVIYLKSGVYTQHDVVVFDRDMFGGKNVKLTITSADTEKAIINGGHQIDNSLFKPADDASIKERLHPDAAGKLIVADLEGTGLEKLFLQYTSEGTSWDYGSQNKNFVSYSSNGTTWKYSGESYSFLTWDENMLQLSQWPNRGYGHINKASDVGPTTRWLKPGEKAAEYGYKNPIGGKFSIVEKPNLEQWYDEFTASEDVTVEGYLDNDWYFQQEKVGAISPNEVKLLRYTRYGVAPKKHRIPRRVRFVNMLCELDQAGEWYFDNKSRKLYIYPIEKFKKTTRINLLSGDIMMVVNNLDGFKIENVIFENGGRLGIEINNSSKALIAGCVFRNFSGRAFNINGGKESGVQSCDFNGLYTVGSLNGDFHGDKSAGTGLHIDAEGLSRQTLEPCHHFMVNNDIHSCRLRGYGLVGLNGVGIRFAHNLLHDMNGAVMYSGNEIVLEYNEFYNLGWELGDWNVAYIGADWASFGNKVKNNFVHHVMETPGGHAIIAFRNDDLGMGVSFENNVFYKAGRGGVTFYGAGNTCNNSIAIETEKVYNEGGYKRALSEEDIKAKWAKIKQYDDGLLVRGDKDDFLWRAERFCGKMGWNFEPYRSKYPLMKKIMDTGRPFMPVYSEVLNNYVDQQSAIDIVKKDISIYPKEATLELPEMIDQSVFKDVSTLNFAFKPEFKTMDGFNDIEFNKIGLIKDKYRPTPPVKEVYRKAIKDRFEGVPSTGGKYNIKEDYKRFPIPKYLVK